MIIICKQSHLQVIILNTNNKHIIIWFQVFIFNTNNFKTDLFYGTLPGNTTHGQSNKNDKKE